MITTIINKSNKRDLFLNESLMMYKDLNYNILNTSSHNFIIEQSDIYVLNEDFEDYEGISLIKKIKAQYPESIVIMVSKDNSDHDLNSHNFQSKKIPKSKNTDYVYTIINKIKMQTKPGLKLHERKWCFYRLNIIDLFHLLMNLLSNSSLPKANQRTLASTIF